MAAKVKGYEVRENEGEGDRVVAVHWVDLAAGMFRAECMKLDGTSLTYEGEYADWIAFDPDGLRVPIAVALEAVAEEVRWRG